MWQQIEKELEDEMLKNAIDFTGNHVLYGENMEKVLKLWKVSSENNLTNMSINRQAWIGHAACYIGIKCPEYITRKAWAFLTDKQRELANLQADRIILLFENSYIGGRDV